MEDLGKVDLSSKVDLNTKVGLVSSQRGWIWTRKYYLLPINWAGSEQAGWVLGQRSLMVCIGGTCVSMTEVAVELLY